MWRLAAWIQVLLIMMMAFICFLGFAFNRIDTNLAAELDRIRLEAIRAARQEIAALTISLRYRMTEAEKKDSVIGEKNAVIEEKMSVIQEKDAAISQKEAVISQKEAVISQKEAVISQREAVIEEKEAVISQKEAVIEEKESIISKQQLQITNLTQLLRRGAAKAESNQGEIRHLKSKLEKVIASARKAIATENTLINQTADGIAKMAMANQMINDLQSSLEAARRESHEWRTEAYNAIVRKMPPSQRGLWLFGMSARNFMPRVPTIQAQNPPDNFLWPSWSS